MKKWKWSKITYLVQGFIFIVALSFGGLWYHANQEIKYFSEMKVVRPLELQKVSYQKQPENLFQTLGLDEATSYRYVIHGDSGDIVNSHYFGTFEKLKPGDNSFVNGVEVHSKALFSIQYTNAKIVNRQLNLFFADETQFKNYQNKQLKHVKSTTAFLKLGFLISFVFELLVSFWFYWRLFLTKQ